MNRARSTAALLALMPATICVGCGGANRTGSPPAAPALRIVEQHWPDGTLRLRKEVRVHADGTQCNDGLFEEWHDNGQKACEVRFVRGHKDGVARRWHRNGRIWTEESYLDGRKHGTCYTWDEDGVKRKEEQYADGQPHGTWTVWDAGGNVKAISRFEHGQPLP